LIRTWPYHSLCCELPASKLGGASSVPRLSVWDLWYSGNGTVFMFVVKGIAEKHLVYMQIYSKNIFYRCIL